MDSEWQAVALSAFEYGNTVWHSIGGAGVPAMVTPSLVVQVKSV